MDLKKHFGGICRHQALGRNRWVGLWRRLGHPSMEDWAEYLRLHGGFAAFGEGNAIVPSTQFADPGLTRIGNNVHMSGAAFFTGHDASVNVINTAFGLRLDSVGPITLGDNIFIGYGAIVLPNVEIGDNVIVGAGAVVTRNVPTDSIIVGNPGKVVGRLTDYVERLKERNGRFPWRELIERREGGFDPAMEPDLLKMRQAYFFGGR